MKKIIKNKYMGIICLFCLMIIIAICSFYTKWQSNKIKEKGLYTIATIYKIKTAGKSYVCYYYYYYCNKKYEGRTSCGIYENQGDRRFVAMLPHEPIECVLTEYRVPSWFTAEAPVEGWKTMPTDEELRTIQNKADSIKAIKNYNKKGGFIYLQFIMNKIEQYFFSKEVKILFEPAKEFDGRATKEFGYSFVKTYYDTLYTRRTQSYKNTYSKS